MAGHGGSACSQASSTFPTNSYAAEALAPKQRTVAAPKYWKAALAGAETTTSGGISDGRTFAQEFWSEARDERWAPIVEREIGKGLSDDLRVLVPDMTNLQMSCRSTLCRITWDGPAELSKRVKSVVENLYPASLHRAKANELFVGYAHGVLASTRGNAQRLVSFYRENRPKILNYLRGSASPPSARMYFSPEMWPLQ